MNFIRCVLFFILNFGALALGGLFTGKGVSSNWYVLLNKAPWTPPGWVFGFVWTIIMICFTIYMAIEWGEKKHKKELAILFLIQWILNVAWNPTFFYFQNIAIGLLVISSLTLLIAYMLLRFRKEFKFYSLLLLPYLIWLFIATSLNGYIFVMN